MRTGEQAPRLDTAESTRLKMPAMDRRARTIVARAQTRSCLPAESPHLVELVRSFGGLALLVVRLIPVGTTEPVRGSFGKPGASNPVDGELASAKAR